jgi:hypothetical protein
MQRPEIADMVHEEIYYEFTNDDRYLDTTVTSGVVMAALRDAWHGVGPYQTERLLLRLGAAHRVGAPLIQRHRMEGIAARSVGRHSAGEASERDGQDRQGGKEAYTHGNLPKLSANGGTCCDNLEFGSVEQSGSRPSGGLRCSRFPPVPLD